MHFTSEFAMTVLSKCVQTLKIGFVATNKTSFLDLGWSWFLEGYFWDHAATNMDYQPSKVGTETQNPKTLLICDDDWWCWWVYVGDFSINSGCWWFVDGLLMVCWWFVDGLLMVNGSVMKAQVESRLLHFVIHIFDLHGDGSNAVVTVNPSEIAMWQPGDSMASDRQELGSRVASKEAVEGASDLCRLANQQNLSPESVGIY